MYLTVHAISGLLIGSQIGNPVWAFLLGFISHFILDAIPHDSIESRDWKNKGEFIKKFILEASIDFWVFAIITLILQVSGNLNLSWPILAGIAGAILPDFIWGLPELFKIKINAIEKYKQFHEMAHKYFYKPLYIPLKYAAFIQISILIILLVLYLLMSF